MTEKRCRLGQFFTEPDVVDLVLGFCLRRPGDRVLDPSCGQGVFLSRVANYRRWLANNAGDGPSDGLWGVEIDPETAEAGRQTIADSGATPHILIRDFFSLEPGGELPGDFDCLVGNPPYTRSERLGRAGQTADYKERLLQCAKPLAVLSRRSGLHAFFFVHGSRFLRLQGRFGFVVSNSWLDVDYGTRLKRFVLAHFKIVAIVESAVERWFSQARVNTSVVILEKCADAAARMQNQVRFARLKRPLHDLFESAPDDPSRVENVESLIAQLLPDRSRLTGDLPVRVVPQKDMRARSKWGMYLRAPDVIFRKRADPRLIQLGDIVRVQRGQTTGANDFFYVSSEARARWRIEDEYLWPLLKSPKGVASLRLRAEQLPERALVVSRARQELAGTHVLRYLQWGESQGYHQRYTCARRPLWYSLTASATPQDRVAFPKGIWNRHFAPILAGKAVIDQQFYRLHMSPENVLVLAALLNSTWAALQAELLGRSNFGHGVLWLAGYEVERIQLPDVREWGPSERRQLEKAYLSLLHTRRLPLAKQVALPAQRSLDSIVFDFLGLDPGEGDAVRRAAVDRVSVRIRRAAAVQRG